MTDEELRAIFTGALREHRTGFFLEPRPSWQCLQCPGEALPDRAAAERHHAEGVLSALSGHGMCVFSAELAEYVGERGQRAAELEDQVLSLEEQIESLRGRLEVAEEGRTSAEKRATDAERARDVSAGKAAAMTGLPVDRSDAAWAEACRLLVDELTMRVEEISAEDPVTARGLRKAALIVRTELA